MDLQTLSFRVTASISKLNAYTRKCFNDGKFITKDHQRKANGTFTAVIVTVNYTAQILRGISCAVLKKSWSLSDTRHAFHSLEVPK
jgi:hypothetical protein